jgi:hypothetical protein
MTQQYTASAILLLTPHGLVATGGPGSLRPPSLLPSLAWTIVLELFVHYADPDEVYRVYQDLIRGGQLSTWVPPEHVDGGSALALQLSRNRLLLTNTSTAASMDVTSVSREHPYVLAALVERYASRPDACAITSRDDFTQIVAQLSDAGLLAPEVRQVDWGDLRRPQPMCASFGFQRGTPIDRYYLQKFVAKIRHRIAGKVVEIGGNPQGPRAYGLSHVVEYVNVDLLPGPGVHLVGDVHDPSLLAQQSVGSIVIFNVLEHCVQPATVVDNMYRWLRPGGRVFCMVPNAQRIHECPADYWRMLPNALRWMFRAFSRQEVQQYGTLASLIASYMGISAEELSHHELDDFHPDYPVATCIAAYK